MQSTHCSPLGRPPDTISLLNIRGGFLKSAQEVWGPQLVFLSQLDQQLRQEPEDVVMPGLCVAGGPSHSAAGLRSCT